MGRYQACTTDEEQAVPQKGQAKTQADSKGLQRRMLHPGTLRVIRAPPNDKLDAAMATVRR